MQVIEIYGDKSRGILGLSQKADIDHVFKRFNKNNCSPGGAPRGRGDKFSKSHCTKKNLRKR